MLNDKERSINALFSLCRIVCHRNAVLQIFLKVAHTNLLCAIPAILTALRSRILLRDLGQQVPGCCSQFRTDEIERRSMFVLEGFSASGQFFYAGNCLPT